MYSGDGESEREFDSGANFFEAKSEGWAEQSIVAHLSVIQFVGN